MKKFFSMFLCVAMLLSMNPAVFADEAAEQTDTLEIVETEASEEADASDEIEEAEQASEEADASDEIEEAAQASEEADASDEIEEAEQASEEADALDEIEEDSELFVQLMADSQVEYSKDGGDWTGSTLTGAVSAIGTGEGTIKVLSDVTLTATLKINGTVTMLADSDVTIKRGSGLIKKPMVEVSSGAELTLGAEDEDDMLGTLTFDGGVVWKDEYPSASIPSNAKSGVNAGECVIYNNLGTLNMYSNVVIQNNYGASGTTHRGSGIGNDGTFNMYGGKIWKNGCYASGETGGAVANNGRDDELWKHTAEFNMYGGEICYNVAFIGGGVSVGSSNNQENGATFNMYGGKIYNNTCSEMLLHAGGGVYVNKRSTFNMIGGEITGNLSITHENYSYVGGLGGGIWAGGIVNISDGAVVMNNTAELAGDDIWCQTYEGAEEGLNCMLNLPSKITADGKEYDVKWYYDGLDIDNDLCDRYPEYNMELTELNDIVNQLALKAVYKEAQSKYAVNIEPTEYGTVEADKTTAAAGEEITLTVTPDEGYEIGTLAVTDENGAAVEVKDNKFTMPESDVTVTATFVLKKYDVEVDSDITGGAVELKIEGTEGEGSDFVQAKPGDRIIITPTPEEYYEIDEVKANDTIVNLDSNGKYIYTVESEDTNVSVTFKKQQFMITDVTEEVNGIEAVNGTVSVMVAENDADGVKYAWGTPVTVTVTPDEHYQVKEVTLNGRDINEFTTQQHPKLMTLRSAGETKTYNILMPTANTELVATYENIAYNVSTTVNDEEMGSVAVIDGEAHAWDEIVNFTVSPKTSYEVSSIEINNGETNYSENDGIYSFTMPQGDAVISVTFKKKEFTIRASGTGITFTNVPTEAVAWGESVTFNAAADEWHIIKSITATGVSIKDNNDGTYTFTMPEGNVEIIGVAERPDHNISFESVGGSSIDGQVVANGNTVTKPAAPTKAGYGFAGWYTDEAYTNKYDFSTPVEGSITLYARWFMWGDVNLDGKVNGVDAMRIQQHMVDTANTLDIPLAGKVNGLTKGDPTGVDAMRIQQYIVKKITSFPVEKTAFGYEFDIENNTYYAPKN